MAVLGQSSFKGKVPIAEGIDAFLFDRDQPGFEIVRRIPIMGPEEHGGHCELMFDGLEVPDEHVSKLAGAIEDEHGAVSAAEVLGG